MAISKACGSLSEIVVTLLEMIRAAPAGAPTDITHINLRQVYDMENITPEELLKLI
jgi:hypothetical protein